MDVNEFGNDEEAPTAATDPELLITESYMAFTLQFREQYNQKSADYKRKCLLAYYNDTRLDYIPASVRAINQWPPIPAKGTTEEQSDYIVKKGIIDKLNDERVDCLFENIIDYEMLSLIGSLLEGELVQDAVKANVRKYADYRTLRHLVTQTRDRLCDVLYTIRFKLLKGVDGGWFEDDDIRGLSISTDYKRSWDASPISIQEALANFCCYTSKMGKYDHSSTFLLKTLQRFFIAYVNEFMMKEPHRVQFADSQDEFVYKEYFKRYVIFKWLPDACSSFTVRSPTNIFGFKYLYLIFDDLKVYIDEEVRKDIKRLKKLVRLRNGNTTSLEKQKFFNQQFIKIRFMSGFLFNLEMNFLLKNPLKSMVAKNIDKPSTSHDASVSPMEKSFKGAMKLPFWSSEFDRNFEPSDKKGNRSNKLINGVDSRNQRFRKNHVDPSDDEAKPVLSQNEHVGVRKSGRTIKKNRRYEEDSGEETVSERRSIATRPQQVASDSDSTDMEDVGKLVHLKKIGEYKRRQFASNKSSKVSKAHTSSSRNHEEDSDDDELQTIFKTLANDFYQESDFFLRTIQNSNYDENVFERILMKMVNGEETNNVPFEKQTLAELLTSHIGPEAYSPFSSMMEFKDQLDKFINSSNAPEKVNGDSGESSASAPSSSCSKSKFRSQETSVSDKGHHSGGIESVIDSVIKAQGSSSPTTSTGINNAKDKKLNLPNNHQIEPMDKKEFLKFLCFDPDSIADDGDDEDEQSDEDNDEDSDGSQYQSIFESKKTRLIRSFNDRRFFRQMLHQQHRREVTQKMSNAQIMQMIVEDRLNKNFDESQDFRKMLVQNIKPEEGKNSKRGKASSSKDKEDITLLPRLPEGYSYRKMKKLFLTKHKALFEETKPELRLFLMRQLMLDFEYLLTPKELCDCTRDGYRTDVEGYHETSKDVKERHNRLKKVKNIMKMLKFSTVIEEVFNASNLCDKVKFNGCDFEPGLPMKRAEKHLKIDKIDKYFDLNQSFDEAESETGSSDAEEEKVPVETKTVLNIKSSGGSSDEAETTTRKKRRSRKASTSNKQSDKVVEVKMEQDEAASPVKMEEDMPQPEQVELKDLRRMSSVPDGRYQSEQHLHYNLSLQRSFELREELDPSLEFHLLFNRPDQDEHTYSRYANWFVGLQNVYNHQLPRMGQEYISRLLFDTRHMTLMLIRERVDVLGGITFRPFKANNFSEVVFCAVTANEQVKGYGSHLMNYLKDYHNMEGIRYLLTYADEYATGYFKKQGFGTHLTIPVENYRGYIKEYMGATLMECKLEPMIRYVHAFNVSQLQRSVIFGLEQRYQKENTIKLDGFKLKSGQPRQLPANIIDVLTSQGVLKDDQLKDLKDQSEELRPKLSKIIEELRKHSHATPFIKLDERHFPAEFLDVTKYKIDLNSMYDRLMAGHYVNMHMFTADLTRMFHNIRSYYGEEAPIYKSSHELEKFAYERMQLAGLTLPVEHIRDRLRPFANVHVRNVKSKEPVTNAMAGEGKTKKKPAEDSNKKKVNLIEVKRKPSSQGDSQQQQTNAAPKKVNMIEVKRKPTISIKTEGQQETVVESKKVNMIEVKRKPSTQNTSDHVDAPTTSQQTRKPTAPSTLARAESPKRTKRTDATDKDEVTNNNDDSQVARRAKRESVNRKK